MSGNMEPGLVLYYIMKPNPIIGADGMTQYAIAGVSQDLPSALNAMVSLPGSRVMLGVIIAKDPKEIAAGDLPPNPFAAKTN